MFIHDASFMLLAMHSYAAFLGINPQLSIAELAASLPDFEKGHVFPGTIQIFQTSAELDQKFLDRLGGTILIAKKITGDSAFTIDDVPTLLATELKGAKGKVAFSLRFIGVPPKRTREFYRMCKDGLKNQGISSRYIGNERDPAKPIQLHDEGILNPKEGAEIVVLQEKEHLWIGRTVGAQNVKAYTHRDMEKPVRDTKVGLLPPKLAQILLNLGLSLVKDQPKELTIFDPFCGTGVIPIEAMIRGFHVLASDKAEKAVTGCEKNIEWTRKKYGVGKKELNTTVWKQDATKPFELAAIMPHVIVTEGTLGPPLVRRPMVKEAEGYCREVEDIATRFVQNCAATLKGVPIVMILPVWYAQKKIVQMNKIWGAIEKAGYRPVLPPHINPTMGRFSLLYRRSDQFVGREIIMLKAK